MMRSARRRGGFSLMEMTVVIGVTSFVIGMATMLLAAMLRRDREARANPAAALIRLSQRFRTDVHAATEIDVPADDAAAGQRSLAVLKQPDGLTITYLLAEDRLIREVREAPEDVPAARDAFSLPTGAEVEIGSQPLGGRTLAVLTLRYPRGAKRSRQTMQVEAVAGRLREHELLIEK